MKRKKKKKEENMTFYNENNSLYFAKELMKCYYIPCIFMKMRTNNMEG